MTTRPFSAVLVTTDGLLAHPGLIRLVHRDLDSPAVVDATVTAYGFFEERYRRAAKVSVLRQDDRVVEVQISRLRGAMIPTAPTHPLLGLHLRHSRQIAKHGYL